MLHCLEGEEELINWNDYPNFTQHEFSCKGLDCCGGRSDMDAEFMNALQSMRTALGFPLPITSGYRCEAHNIAVNGGIPHPTGKAADIQISGDRAFKLLHLAGNLMTGIGLLQHGIHAGRFIHLDMLDSEGGKVARPTIWSYG